MPTTAPHGRGGRSAPASAASRKFQLGAASAGAEGDLKPAHSVTFSEDYASEYGARDSAGLSSALPRRRKGFGSVVASIFGGYDRDSHTANKIERERDAIVEL